MLFNKALFNEHYQIVRTQALESANRTEDCCWQARVLAEAASVQARAIQLITTPIGFPYPPGHTTARP